MSRPELLFLSQQAPWPRESGGNIRSHALLAALAEDHDVTLIASAAPDARDAAARALGPLCARVVLVDDTKRRDALGLARTAARALARRRPLVIEHNRNPLLAAAAREALAAGRFATLHLNHVDTVSCVAGQRTPPAVLDTHNLYFDYFARQAARAAGRLRRAVFAREARALRRYELAAFRAAGRVLVCSEPERARLAELDPALEVRVVPNGADCAALRPSSEDPWDNPPDLAFVGDMAYGPNDDAARWFADQVLPRVRAAVPAARFVAIGKHPSAALRALAEGRDDVVVTGFVEDVAAALYRARAAVVPLRFGAGTRLKVLEALALGLPLVSTRLGAEGIALADGREVLLADEPEALAAACVRALTERDLHAGLRREGRRAVEARYDWRAIGALARAAHAELVGAPPVHWQ